MLLEFLNKYYFLVVLAATAALHIIKLVRLSVCKPVQSVMMHYFVQALYLAYLMILILANEALRIHNLQSFEYD